MLNEQRGFATLVALFAIGAFMLQGCTASPSDTIKLANEGSHENGVLVDGTKEDGSFDNDKPFRSSPGNGIRLGNYTAPPGEIIAFTRGRAPTLKTSRDSQEPVPFWTSGSDTKELKFENEYVIDVYFWIISGSVEQQWKRALHAYYRTQYILAKERQGIRLNGFNIEDRTTDQDGIAQRSAFNCSDYQDLSGYDQDNPRYKPHKINIYYVDQVVGENNEPPSAEYGSRCYGDTDIPGVFILMGDNTSAHLLAHEVGHALNLEHIDQFSDSNDPSQPYFTETNVMHSASNTRKFLTEGQTFRAVVLDGSALNRKDLYNARPNLIPRKCNTLVTQDPDDPQGCPPIHTRIWVDR